MSTMSASQAARELGVTVRRVSQLCIDKTLSAHKDENGHWRIEADSIREYLHGILGAPRDARRRGGAADRAVEAEQTADASLDGVITQRTILSLLSQQQIALQEISIKLDLVLRSTVRA